MADQTAIRSKDRGRGKVIRNLSVCVVLTLGVFAWVRMTGQQGVPNPIGQRPHNPFESLGDKDDPLLAARQMRAMNADRQKSLVSDTAKLLKLAQELNKEVENSNLETLTPVELRKIADIEKLARNVKQKMSISYSGGPSGFDLTGPGQTR